MKSRGEKQSQQKKLQVRASQKKEDAIARNVRKVVRHGVFPMICGAAVARNAISATVAQSAFGSQNAQNTACWDRNRLGLAFGSRNVLGMVRHCDAKRIWKSKIHKTPLHV